MNFIHDFKYLKIHRNFKQLFSSYLRDAKTSQTAPDETQIIRYIRGTTIKAESGRFRVTLFCFYHHQVVHQNFHLQL